eukprot:180434_1
MDCNCILIMMLYRILHIIMFYLWYYIHVSQLQLVVLYTDIEEGNKLDAIQTGYDGIEIGYVIGEEITYELFSNVCVVRYRDVFHTVVFGACDKYFSVVCEE